MFAKILCNLYGSMWFEWVRNERDVRVRFSPPPPTLDGQNRQSPIASVQRTRSTLASHSAVPHGKNTTSTNANRAIRIATHNERRVYEDQILCFGGRYDRQRTLVIRIAAITLASDSAITIARFRPSKRPTPEFLTKDFPSATMS